MRNRSLQPLLLALGTLFVPALASAQLSTTRTPTTSTGTSTCSGDKVQLTGFALTPSNPALSQNVTVTVSMKNLCGSTLNIPYVITDGSTTVHSGVHSVAANQTASVQYTWAATQGSHSFDAYLNASNTLAEASTALTNNGAATPVVFSVEGWNAWADKAKTGTRSAVRKWFQAAAFGALVVNGNLANGGVLAGPPMLPLARLELAAAGVPATAADAIAAGFSDAWTAWAASVRTPPLGLPWYPAFLAMASNPARPTPNTPTTLGALIQITVTNGELSQLIRNRLPANALTSGAGPAVDGFASWAAGCFSGLKQSPLINVIGTGPVPTFVAPTWVPGVVTAGVGAGAPGHIVPNFC